ncbi:hypothetical protein HAX54_020110 [Datura stramonium]|uniref:Uncharacterized protein n=1 Tax=Datura stramonium TaxID=4076 RepID=A0ABS8UQE4_DATST|nr:hypothetical protein [Datura stramonium]
MKASWGETSNEELEGEDVENDNLTLIARSDSDSDSAFTEKSEDEHETSLIQSSTERVSALALTEGTIMENESLNVPSESGRSWKIQRE